jgi:mercuric ion transport protein
METVDRDLAGSAAGFREAGNVARALPMGLAAAGGLLGALAASSCCIVPLALFTLGVGGAWIGNLAALEPYQPYFRRRGDRLSLRCPDPARNLIENGASP